jgi:hypothetical protein
MTHSLVAASAAMAPANEQVFGFQYVIITEKSPEDASEHVVFFLHLGQMDNVVEEQFARPFRRNTGNSLIGAVYDDSTQRADF